MERDDSLHVIDDGADMIQLLQKFAQTKQHLRLRLPNREENYSTLIIDCDWQQRKLTLDQAISPDGPVSLQNYFTVELDGTLAGVHYTLQGIPLLEGESDGESDSKKSWQTGFPLQISYRQRRQSFRTSIPRALSSNLEIKIDDSDLLFEGRLLDLSASGLACECLLPPEADDKTIATLKLKKISLSIELDDLLTVVCDGQIKEILPSHQTEVLRFGIEFDNLSPSLQRLIDKAVVDVQRVTRKNQTR
jgi:c-di-GMP-binding flagellar brake protein YcgR